MSGSVRGYGALAVSRAIKDGREPARHEILLDESYRASVFVHAPAGAGAHWPVVYAHGIQSHPGWFAGSAAHLASAGHPVYQFTRRGSGDNGGARGHAHSLEQAMADVACWCRFAREHSGCPRVHLLGVSWGGKLLACYAASGTDGELASLVLVAPGLCPRVDVGLATKLSIAGALLVNPHQYFDIPLNDPALFTDNPAMRAYLEADELGLRRASARFLHVSRQMDRYLARRPRGSITAPTCLVLASRDRIIDNARTGRLVDRLTAGWAVTRTLEGAHTLEFEPDTTPLYQTIAAALEQAQT